MNIPWNAYWRLMRFDKPIGTLLLLWPTWIALLLAGAGRPALKNILIFTAGVVLMLLNLVLLRVVGRRKEDLGVDESS